MAGFLTDVSTTGDSTPLKFTGPDFATARSRQKARAVELYGLDEVATEQQRALGGHDSYPAVHAAYGLAVGEFWLSVARQCVLPYWKAATDRAGDYLVAVIPLELFSRGGPIPYGYQLDRIRASSPSAYKLIDAATWVLKAVKVGAGARRYNAAGIQIIDSISCAIFWDSVTRVSIEATGARAVVTESEKWTAFVEGAAEGAAHLPTSAGYAAGAILGKAGEVVGEGLGGLVDGLGLVKLGILVGGAYVATKVI